MLAASGRRGRTWKSKRSLGPPEASRVPRGAGLAARRVRCEVDVERVDVAAAQLHLEPQPLDHERRRGLACLEDVPAERVSEEIERRDVERTDRPVLFKVLRNGRSRFVAVSRP